MQRVGVLIIDLRGSSENRVHELLYSLCAQKQFYAHLTSSWQEGVNSLPKSHCRLLIPLLESAHQLSLAMLEAIRAHQHEVRILPIFCSELTGKELFARAIHYLGPRQSKPFIPVNCAAIPIELFANEPFGHVKGAFAGATHERKGLLEQAQHGTLFMDEVANLPIGRSCL